MLNNCSTPNCTYNNNSMVFYAHLCTYMCMCFMYVYAIELHLQIGLENLHKLQLRATSKAMWVETSTTITRMRNYL